MSNDTQGEEKIAGTNLTTVSEYNKTALGLAELKNKFANVVYDVTVSKEMKAAKEARGELRTLRTTLEKTRKEIKAPALQRCQEIDAEAKRLTAEISDLEDPIDAQIKAEEARVEAERAAKALAEEQRVQGHRDAIQRMRDFPLSLQGKPADVMELKLKQFAPPGSAFFYSDYEEFSDEARDAFTAACASANALIDAARRREEHDRIAEENAKRVAEQEAELAELRKEKADREAAEAKREREMREYDEQQERMAREHEARIEREKEEAAQRERDDAERARMAEQAEAQRKEQDRLDRERKAHEAQVENDRIARLGLMDAVKAVVEYAEKGSSDVPRCILDLCEVYYAIPQEKRTAATPARHKVKL